MMQTKEAIAITRVVSYNFPVFLLLFISCALVMYIYLAYYKKTMQIFSSVISYSVLQQTKREGHSFFRSFSISLFLIYMLCGGIFFSDLAIYQGWLNYLPHYTLLLVSTLSIGIIILLRFFLTAALGLLLKEKTAIEDVFFQYTYGVYAEALAGLVFCLLVHYSSLPASYLILIAIIVWGLLYAIRLVKTVTIGRSIYGFSLFHLILYLCAVEIIPLVVFVKLFVNS